MRFPFHGLVILLGVLVTAPVPAVVLFQSESFDGASAWAAGVPHPSPPAIQSDSGPLGTSDPALRIVSSAGGGPGSRLAAFNRTDWVGDYSGAGITALTMDLRNQSILDASVRIALNGPGGWFVTAAELLGSFTPWQRAAFDLRPGSLSSAGGNNVSDTLGSVTELRILHNPDPDFRGGPGRRTLLVDNIRAVPEPGPLCLLALGGIFLGRRNRTVAPPSRFV